MWASIATALSFPGLLITIILERRRSADERARQSQLVLSQRYSEFLRMGMDFPELELSDLLSPGEVSAPMSDSKLQYRRLVALQMLVSLFEDAHFLLSDSRSALRRHAWAGWEQYIAYWMSRPDFRDAWHTHFAEQYNSKFMEYMEKRWPITLDTQ